jgi:hypothetical protein
MQKFPQTKLLKPKISRSAFSLTPLQGQTVKKIESPITRVLESFITKWHLSREKNGKKPFSHVWGVDGFSVWI